MKPAERLSSLRREYEGDCTLSMTAGHQYSAPAQYATLASHPQDTGEAEKGRIALRAQEKGLR